jgi:mono/diheme cytochrome c family protein
MRDSLLVLHLLLVSDVSLVFGGDTQSNARSAAERGRDILFHRSLNPPLWSKKAYNNVWKQWGVAERPRDYDRAFRDRYGLHTSPDAKARLPLGLMEAQGLLSKGIINNCLLCHAGTIAGQTVIGLGNASLDLQGLFADLSAADGMTMQFPFQFSHVRGTIDPIGPLVFLMQLRDADLNLQKPAELDFTPYVCSDPPAWWLLKKKKTRDWTGAIDARSKRVDMVNLLTPLNSAAYIKQKEPVFADIHALVLATEPPKYPFAIDQERAARGQGLFHQHCSRCHGTYGARPTYPNKIVPLETLGTDRTLADSTTTKNVAYFNRSWFMNEAGPDGRPFAILETPGYQAPPLDGIWATAPYFHNGSVPTVYHVLNSKARPRIYTRSYHTDKDAYDPVRLGWKITVLSQSPDPKLPAHERHRIYDTTLPGRRNTGHIFGDKLTEQERLAVIEYLKTL